MEIIRENTGELTATLHLTISPDDYQPKIDAALKKLQRDSVFPGFRKGKTPMGHIKRLYGKAIIVDEVDKVISENLEKYISENNLDLLGYPLSNPNNQPIDFDNPGTHEFLFDIALTPAFELHPEIIEHIDYQVIIPDDETIDKQIQQYKTTHSTESEDEISGPESILWLEFAEVDDNGHEFEGGLKQNGFISLKNDLLPAGIAQQFEGKSKNDTLILNALEFAGSEENLAKLLHLTPEVASGIQGRLRFTVQKVTSWIEPEMGTEFFEKVFPGKGITLEADFRKAIAENTDNSYAQNLVNQLFLNKVADRIVQTHNLTLPDEFLKRWLIRNSEDKLSPEQVEEEYNTRYAKGIRWEIIENKIREKNNLAVTREDTRHYIREQLINTYFSFLKHNEEADERLGSIIDRIMENKEEVKRAYDAVSERKITDYLKSVLKLNLIETTITEFIAQMDAMKNSRTEETPADNKTSE